MRSFSHPSRRHILSGVALAGVIGALVAAPTTAAAAATPLAFATGSSPKTFTAIEVGTSVPLPMTGCQDPGLAVVVGKFVDANYTYVTTLIGASISNYSYTPALGTSDLLLDCLDFTDQDADIANGVPNPRPAVSVNQIVASFTVVPVTPPVEPPVVPVANDYVSLTPYRLMDTRIGPKTVDGQAQGGNVRDAGSVTVLQVAGRNSFPNGAKAVSLNVTVTAAEGDGFATVYPCGVGTPDASNLNFVAGQTIPNAVITKLAANGTVCLFTSARTQMIVDINGYFPSDSRFIPTDPGRIMDTRPTGATVDTKFARIGTLKANSVTELDVTGRFNIPATAKSVALNVTVAGAREGGFVTVYPCGAVPDASNLNYQPGSTIPNLVMATLSPTGKVCISTTGEVDLLVDVNGYLPGVSSFVALVPGRIMDSRATGATVDGRSQRMGPIAANTFYELQVAGRHNIPANARTAILNVTVTGALGNGFATVYPCGSIPDASNLNYVAGQTIPNAVIAKLSATGTICLFVEAGTDLLVDVNTYLQTA